MTEEVGVWGSQSGRVYSLWCPQVGATQGSSEGKEHDTEIWSGGADWKIRRWKNGKCINVLEGHKDWVKTLHGRGRLMFSGSFDETIRCWDTDSFRCVQVYRGHFNCVYSIQATLQSLYSSSGDETVKRWDLATGQCAQTFLGHDGYVNCVQVETPEDIADANSPIISGDLTGSFNRIPTNTTSSAEVAYSGGYDQKIRIWDKRTSRAQSVIGADDKVLSLALWGQYFMAGLDNNQIAVYDKRKPTETITNMTGHTSFINQIYTHSLKPFLCSASADRTVRIWSLNEFNLCITLTGHSSFVDSAVFGADPKYMVVYSGSQDETIRRWKIDYDVLENPDRLSGSNPLVFTGSSKPLGNHLQPNSDEKTGIIMSTRTLGVEDEECTANEQGEYIQVAADESVPQSYCPDKDSPTTNRALVESSSVKTSSFQTLLYAARKTASIAKYVENAILSTFISTGQPADGTIDIFSEPSRAAQPLNQEVQSCIQQGQNSVLQIELIRLQETLQEERDQRTEDRKSWNDRIQTLEDRVSTLESAIKYLLSTKNSSISQEVGLSDSSLGFEEERGQSIESSPREGHATILQGTPGSQHELDLSSSQ